MGRRPGWRARPDWRWSGAPAKGRRNVRSDRAGCGQLRSEPTSPSVPCSPSRTASALAQDIDLLSRKRLAAVSRGRDLAKSTHAPARTRVELASEAAALNCTRIACLQLVEELEQNQKALWQIERELLKVGELSWDRPPGSADRHHGRELDPNWLNKAASLRGRG
jgi:hypothetical protein